MHVKLRDRKNPPSVITKFRHQEIKGFFFWGGGEGGGGSCSYIPKDFLTFLLRTILSKPPAAEWSNIVLKKILRNAGNGFRGADS